MVLALHILHNNYSLETFELSKVLKEHKNTLSVCIPQTKFSPVQEGIYMLNSDSYKASYAMHYTGLKISIVLLCVLMYTL